MGRKSKKRRDRARRKEREFRQRMHERRKPFARMLKDCADGLVPTWWAYLNGQDLDGYRDGDRSWEQVEDLRP